MSTMNEFNPTPADTMTASVYSPEGEEVLTPVDEVFRVTTPTCLVNPASPASSEDFQVLAGGLDPSQWFNVVMEVGPVTLGWLIKSGDDGTISRSLSVPAGSGTLAVRDLEGDELCSHTFTVL